MVEQRARQYFENPDIQIKLAPLRQTDEQGPITLRLVIDNHRLEFVAYPKEKTGKRHTSIYLSDLDADVLLGSIRFDAQHPIELKVHHPHVQPLFLQTVFAQIKQYIVNQRPDLKDIPSLLDILPG